MQKPHVCAELEGTYSSHFVSFGLAEGPRGREQQQPAGVLSPRLADPALPALSLLAFSPVVRVS